MPTPQRNTWDCSYCKVKKLQKSRNCYGRYQKTTIRITSKIYFDRCPMSMLNPLDTQIYEIVNMSFSQGMGNSVGLPDQLLNLPNAWFEYNQTIRRAEGDFKEDKNE